MLQYLLIGSGFAFAAAVQPGPLQAFLLSSVARHGWKRTLPAACAPLISDIPIALLALFVLNQMPLVVNRALQIAGGLFLIYLAWLSYRQWRRTSSVEPEIQGSAPNTLFQAVTVNLLNPNPYLGWSLVLGPAFLSAWQQAPVNAAGLLVAFYAVLVAVTAGIVMLFGATHFLNPKTRRTLILVSAGLLALIGVYQLVAGLLKTA